MCLKCNILWEFGKTFLKKSQSKNNQVSSLQGRNHENKKKYGMLWVFETTVSLIQDQSLLHVTSLSITIAADTNTEGNK